MSQPPMPHHDVVLAFPSPMCLLPRSVLPHSSLARAVLDVVTTLYVHREPQIRL
jgi:hypothetical protein